MSIATSHKTHDRYATRDKPGHLRGAPTVRAGIRELNSEFMMSLGTRAHRFHLRTVRGLYLHMSCEFLTKKREDAWVGTATQARACRAKFPAARECKLRRVIHTIPVHSEEEA